MGLFRGSALFFSVAVFVIAVPGFVPAASAQEAQETQETTETSEADERAARHEIEARTLFEAGRMAFGDGRFEDALDSFQRAYELSELPHGDEDGDDERRRVSVLGLRLRGRRRNDNAVVLPPASPELFFCGRLGGPGGRSGLGGSRGRNGLRHGRRQRTAERWLNGRRRRYLS